MDPKLSRPDASPGEIQTAKKTLLHTLFFFADREKIIEKYKLNAKAGDDLFTYTTNYMDPALLVLNNKMRELAIKRQNGTNFLSWATLIDNLERHFHEAVS
jgi:hypothetical protein